MSLSDKFKKLKEQESAVVAPKPKIQKAPKKFLPIKNIEIKKIEPKTPQKNTIDFDFNVLANSSDFKRLIYLAIIGKVWRGTDKGLNLVLNNKLNTKRK